MSSVRVVTDSTATLPPELAAERGIVVVPLEVVIGAEVFEEGSEGATPETVAQALREFKPVSTSRPSPAHLLEVYEQAAREGASAVVSIHLSGEMSGTYESAQLAAEEASIPVHAVDSRQVGVATGFAALTAADVLDAGGAPEEAATARAGASRGGPVAVLRRHPGVPPPWWPDRRGGRDVRGCARGEAPAADRRRAGRQPREGADDGSGARRGSRSSRSRRPARRDVDVCVAHLASPERAEQLPAKLSERLAENLDGREVWCAELGAVLGAHVGPGMLAVCVAPRP